MAASGMHVGRLVQKNSRLVLKNIDSVQSLRSFAWTSSVRQNSAAAPEVSPEAIVIPRKKTWSKEAVLEALAATVKRDPTAYSYQFQDDPYLSPRTSAEFKLYSLSQESGRAAAKYFINSNPKFFTKDYAEPHIPCLMPSSVSSQLDEVCEEALKERISLKMVSSAVDMYDQLLQAGQVVSMDMTHDLLDLICLYGDRDPPKEGQPEREDTEEPAEDMRKRKGRVRRASDLLNVVWKENNNAERVFNLLPHRDTRCYSALIRGMVKYGAYEKAFSLYRDLLNNRMSANVHIFNALILAAPDVRERHNEKWDLIAELLNHMNQQQVSPDLMTFNLVLKALRRCGPLGRTQSLHTLSEMKALGITPSLATFNHLLGVFYKAASSAQGQTDILQEVLSELAGQSFTCRDPDDVLFFANAMRICVDNKDVVQAYRVHSLTEVGENWRLMGDSYQQSIYYGRFFNVLCMMESVDVVMEWYHRLIPTLYYPNSHGLRDLLQVLDADNRLELIPTIWKDIKTLGHDNKIELVEEVLALMARDKHSPEVQQAFAACALDVKGVFEGDRARPGLDWSTSCLSHITSILLHTDMSQQAWEMLQLFKAKNRVPPEKLFEDFLSVCLSAGASQRAVELVQLSAAFCLSATPRLAQQVLREFQLTQDQRDILSEIDLTEQSTD